MVHDSIVLTSCCRSVHMLKVVVVKQDDWSSTECFLADSPAKQKYSAVVRVNVDAERWEWYYFGFPATLSCLDCAHLDRQKSLWRLCLASLGTWRHRAYQAGACCTAAATGSWRGWRQCRPVTTAQWCASTPPNNAVSHGWCWELAELVSSLSIAFLANQRIRTSYEKPKRLLRLLCVIPSALILVTLFSESFRTANLTGSSNDILSLNVLLFWTY